MSENPPTKPPTTKPERAFSDSFAETYGGSREVWVGFGRIDVVTDGLAVEVEPYRTWREGVRQALAYSALTPYDEVPKLKPALAVFGRHLDYNAGLLMMRALEPLRIRLFLHNGLRWHDLRSQRDLMPSVDWSWHPVLLNDDVDILEVAAQTGLSEPDVRRLIRQGKVVRPVTVAQIEALLRPVTPKHLPIGG